MPKDKMIYLAYFLALTLTVSCINSPQPTKENPITTLQTAKNCDLEFTKLGLCSSYQWSKVPRIGQPGSVNLKFTDKNGASPEVGLNYYLEAYLQVPIQPNFFVAYKVQQFLDPDYFSTQNIEFNFVGDYKLYVQLKNAGGAIVDQAFKSITMTTQGIKSECPYDFTGLQLCSSIGWKSNPRLGPNNSFEFKTWNYTSLTNGPYVSPTQNLRVVVWNTDKKLQEPDAVVSKTQDGIYQISALTFSATGNYEIWIQFVFPNGQIADQVKAKLNL